MFFNIGMYFFLLITILINASEFLDLSQIPKEQIAIVQFDSRPLKNYWLTAAQWNAKYCQQHGHLFIYYTTQDNCHYGHEPLADAWCKVRAMLNANEDFPKVQIFFYLDSDAVIDKDYAHLSLNEMIRIMQGRLSWDPAKKPIIFNQDGPCWWCSFIMKIGYTMCLNAGTVVWYRHEISSKILKDWWDASMDSYETNPIKRFVDRLFSCLYRKLTTYLVLNYCYNVIRKFRLKWPWEQDRQMALYNRSSQYIQIASQPERVFMQLAAGVKNGWCLSHLPEAKCFISHYCANGKSKQKMRQLYDDLHSLSIRWMCFRYKCSDICSHHVFP